MSVDKQNVEQERGTKREVIYEVDNALDVSSLLTTRASTPRAQEAAANTTVTTVGTRILMGAFLVVLTGC